MRIMLSRRPGASLALASLTAFFLACGSSGSSSDTGPAGTGGSVAPDAAVDSAQDSPSDAPLDQSAEADPPDANEASIDAADDAVEDAVAEVAQDAPEEVSLPDASGWRSKLYPAGWTAATTDPSGMFLHDFSYAGYHYGETQLGIFGPTNTVDVVVSFNADPTGAADSTAAVQAAIDSVAVSGGVVVFPAGSYRIDGMLSITHSNTVLRGAGSATSRLQFSRVQGMQYRGHISFTGALQSDLELPLASDGVNRTNVVEVANAGTLSVGDEVAIGWVITPEFIAEHNMTGTWDQDAFHDQWQTFFRRTVTAIDTTVTPAKVTVDVPLRYPAKVRDAASVRREHGYLREVGVEALSVSNAVSLADAWSLNQVAAVRFDNVADGWVRDVTSFASSHAPTSGAGTGAHLQSGGLVIGTSKRMTVADSQLEFAENRGGGGNGYLFEMRQSSELLFRDLVARKGRHNFIQNWGFGNTGCVWLRVHSSESVQEYNQATAGFGPACYSDFHHSLATANLIDASTFDDGIKMVNRGSESTYAGITGTQNVFWNTSGAGYLQSMQYQTGYVIGTQAIKVVLTPGALDCLGMPACHDGTAPDDYTEGLGLGGTLIPQSLYEDQLARRLAP